MKKPIRFILLFILIIGAACLIRSFKNAQNPGSELHSSDISSGNISDEAHEKLSCTITAVGDNLLHNTVISAAKNGEDYEFSPFYELVTDYIKNSDIAIVNQEAPLGGPDYSPSGYPNFNSPQQVGRDLVEAGFNVINHANNHALDRGAGAVYDTIDFWEQYEQDGVMMTGIYRDAEQREQLKIMKRNGISFGFVSYTYGTNGIPLPKDNPDLVSLIDEQRISYDMDRLSGQCDVIIAIMHWGEEYTHKPNDTQRQLAQKLTELGADIIIGHHPHVIQPAEWIEAENGNRAFCIFSLGNFISSQNKTATMLEGMLLLTVTKHENGNISVENPQLMPLVNYFNKGWKTFRIYPLSEYTEEIAATHGLGTKLTPDYFKNLADEVFGEFCKWE